MNRGKISTVRQFPSVNDQIDETYPMPCVGTGEALDPAVYTTTSAYAKLAGSQFDTQQTGHPWLGYQVAGATHDVKVKLCGSFDASAWTDLTADDETGVAQAGAELTITVPATVFLMIPGKDGRSCFRYYALFAKDAVGGVHGVVTAHGFTK